MTAGHFKGQRVGPYTRQGINVTPLRQLRLDLALTQVQAAEALNMAVSTYRERERQCRELHPNFAPMLHAYKSAGARARKAPATTDATAQAVRSSAAPWPFPAPPPAQG